MVTFVLTVTMRACSRAQIPNFISKIVKFLKQSVGLSIWLLECFSCQEMIREFLVDCTVPDMARFTAGLLTTAMQTIYKFEEQAMLRYLEQPDLADFIARTQVQADDKSQIGDLTVYTAGQKPVPIYLLEKTTSDLPVLVTMINSFLHY